MLAHTSITKSLLQLSNDSEARDVNHNPNASHAMQLYTGHMQTLCTTQLECTLEWKIQVMPYNCIWDICFHARPFAQLSRNEYRYSLQHARNYNSLVHDNITMTDIK